MGTYFCWLTSDDTRISYKLTRRERPQTDELGRPGDRLHALGKPRTRFLQRNHRARTLTRGEETVAVGEEQRRMCGAGIVSDANDDNSHSFAHHSLNPPHRTHALFVSIGCRFSVARARQRPALVWTIRCVETHVGLTRVRTRY